jgi:hypothetical protein
MQKTQKQNKNQLLDCVTLCIKEILAEPIKSITQKTNQHFNIETNHSIKDLFLYKGHNDKFFKSQITIKAKDTLDNLHKKQAFVDKENNFKLNLDNKKQNDIIYFYLKKFQQTYDLYQSRFNLKSQNFNDVVKTSYNPDELNSKDWYDFYYNYILNQFKDKTFVSLKIFTDIVLRNISIKDVKIYNKESGNNFTKDEVIKILIGYGLDLQTYTKEASKLFNK